MIKLAAKVLLQYIPRNELINNESKRLNVSESNEHVPHENGRMSVRFRWWVYKVLTYQSWSSSKNKPSNSSRNLFQDHTKRKGLSRFGNRPVVGLSLARSLISIPWVIPINLPDYPSMARRSS